MENGSMIEKIRLQKFKRFKDHTIDLKSQGITVLAGGNNSGKSSLLHAIAIWEFCKLILKVEKGPEALLAASGGQGLGVSADEFLPIALPSLKHLWTNLKSQKEGTDTDGYNLKISCFWTLNSVEKHLEIGLSLANDRLFIKVTSSNIAENEHIPTAAYLPTFAGILERESKVSLAERRKLVGKGLAGSVLRNLILEIYEKNKKERERLKKGRTKISNRDLKILKGTDPYELLLRNIRDIFRTGLRIKDFNDLYHTYIKIDSYKGEYTDRRVFKKYPKYNPRDLMVEGSGFLQWLNVFSLSLNPEINILLLDEPDAHLHPSLQFKMIEELDAISRTAQKQVLIATHSSEIIKSIKPMQIMQIGTTIKYLNTESQKVGLLAGIGAEYSPQLDKLKRTKKVLFVEGEIDYKFLKRAGEIIDSPISEEIIPWITATGHKERKHLFVELSKEIPGLRGLSIRDRDDEPVATVDESLRDKIHTNGDTSLYYCKWKRRNIESYLVIPAVIAKVSNKTENDVREYIAEKFGLAIPSNFLEHNVPEAIIRANGKNILIENGDNLCSHFDISRYSIINALTKNDLCADIQKMVHNINDHFA